MLKQLHTIVNHVQQMQQTYKTNDKHIKMKKQYVVQTHAKSTQTMSNNLQTIAKHVQQIQQTYQTNDKNIQKMTKTICCTNKCKTYTNNFF